MCNYSPVAVDEMIKHPVNVYMSRNMYIFGNRQTDISSLVGKVCDLEKYDIV